MARKGRHAVAERKFSCCRRHLMMALRNRTRVQMTCATLEERSWAKRHSWGDRCCSQWYLLWYLEAIGIPCLLIKWSFSTMDHSRAADNMLQVLFLPPKVRVLTAHPSRMHAFVQKHLWDLNVCHLLGSRNTAVTTTGEGPAHRKLMY